MKILNILSPVVITTIIIVSINIYTKMHSNKNTYNNYMMEGMSLSMIFGTSMSMIININMGLGISFGLLVGMVIGLNIRK